LAFKRKIKKTFSATSTGGSNPVDEASKACGILAVAPGRCFRQCVTTISLLGSPEQGLGDAVF